MPRPATTARSMCWKRPSRAAASEGTTNSVYWMGRVPSIEAIRMPATPATAALIIQFTAASRSGAMLLT
jgi:hypothetical protein